MTPRRVRPAPRRSVSRKREGHDASGFYDRFEPPRLIDDDSVEQCPVKDQLICADGRGRSKLYPTGASLSSSPPLHTSPARNTKPSSVRAASRRRISSTSGMLRDVFAECWRVLEPGGRIAVNVANLGRKPYRSLSADVIRILQDDLGFLLRGEILWVKGRGANGNCAWGSYASAANPSCAT